MLDEGKNEERTLAEWYAQLPSGGKVDTAFAGYPISKIQIRTLPVFLSEDVFSWAVNRTHFTTRRYVVQRELLFGVGDNYDPDLALETERILRATGLFSDVWIIPVVERDPETGVDSLLVEVTTQDRYSLYLSLAYRTGGGLDEFEFQIGEDNFLGWGDLLNVGYFDTPVEQRYRLAYSKRRLVEYWQIAFRGEHQQDDIFKRNGNLILAEVERPLYARKAKWAFRAFYNSRKESEFRLIGDEIRLAGKDYDDPSNSDLPPSQQFRWASRVDLQEYGATYLRSWGYNEKFNASLGFQVTEEDYRPLEELNPVQAGYFRGNVVPQDRLRKELLLGAEFETLRFSTDKNLNIFGITEDVTLGWRIGFGWAISEEEFGSDSTYARPRLEWASNFRFGGRSYLQTQFLASKELAAAGAVDNFYYLNLKTFLRPWGESLLTAGGRLVLRDETDPNDLSSLGGDTGLRGYLVDAFIGPDMIRLNAEWRTPPLKVWFVYVAGAVFVDAGHVGDRLWHDDLRVGAGLGLRIGLPQFTASLMYADFAYAFNQPDNQGDLKPLDRFYFSDDPPF